MLRKFAVIALFLAALPVMTIPATAETQEERAERCAAQNAIVVQAIDLRLSRKSEAKALAAIQADERDMVQKFASSIPGMVGLVYAMKRKDVKELNASSFETACLAYEQ